MLSEFIRSSILNDIRELGYVSFQNGMLQTVIKPIENEFSQYKADLSAEDNIGLDRWNSTIRFLKDYSSFHPMNNSEYFLCLYDGWREYSAYVKPNERIYTPWLSFEKEDRMKYFIGKGVEGESRFMHNHPNEMIYPTLPIPILAYNRHIDDFNVFLIPDAIYLNSQYYEPLKRYIDNYDTVPFENKHPTIFWRGSSRQTGYKRIKLSNSLESFIHSFNSSIDLTRIHPRDVAVIISNNNYNNISSIFDVAFTSNMEIPIKDMLDYKYSLDMDGMVSSWSSMFWKLYGRSIVIKLASHWEQWYYRDLVPFIHYLPLASLDPIDIEGVYMWCELFNTKCNNIVFQSTQFVHTQLSYHHILQNHVLG
eukprot:gene13640-18303_t